MQIAQEANKMSRQQPYKHKTLLSGLNIVIEEWQEKFGLIVRYN